MSLRVELITASPRRSSSHRTTASFSQHNPWTIHEARERREGRGWVVILPKPARLTGLGHPADDYGQKVGAEVTGWASPSPDCPQHRTPDTVISQDLTEVTWLNVTSTADIPFPALPAMRGRMSYMAWGGQRRQAESSLLGATFDMAGTKRALWVGLGKFYTYPHITVTE